MALSPKTTRDVAQFSLNGTGHYLNLIVSNIDKSLEATFFGTRRLARERVPAGRRIVQKIALNYCAAKLSACREERAGVNLIIYQLGNAAHIVVTIGKPAHMYSRQR